MAEHLSIDDTLSRYVLKNIKEVEVNEPNQFRCGSDAEIVELNWNGTRCVGKKLHPIFFQEDSDPNGIQYLEKKFCKEIKLLSEMKHPNIVQFLGLYYPPQKSNVASRPLPIMVMEKMDYSLTEYLKSHRKGSIPREKVIGILSDVARGLIYLHVVQGVAHRDLSSNNILVTETLSGTKIADFGSARILDNQSQTRWMVKLTTQPGTKDFMPPEALEDPPKYNQSVDVFSFGCVIIHLATHKWPEPCGKIAHYNKILSEWDRRHKLILEMGVYDFLQPIVEKCLKDKAHLRPSSKEVLSSLEDIPKESRTQCLMAEPLGRDHHPYMDRSPGLFSVGTNHCYNGGRSGPATLAANHPCIGGNFSDPLTMGPVTVGPIMRTNHPDVDVGSSVNPPTVGPRNNFYSHSNSIPITMRTNNMCSSNRSEVMTVPNLGVFDKAITCIRELEKKIVQQDELIHVQQLHSEHKESEIERLYNECNKCKKEYETVQQQLYTKLEQTKELEQEYKHVQSEQDNVIAKNEGELEDIKLRYEKLKQNYDILHDEKIDLNSKYERLKRDYEILRDNKMKYGNDELVKTRRYQAFGKAHSMPAVHRDHRRYPVEERKLTHNPEKFKYEDHGDRHKLKRHSNEPRKYHQPNWSTLAMYNGEYGDKYEDQRRLANKH